jgi:hypothetical protein
MMDTQQLILAALAPFALVAALFALFFIAIPDGSKEMISMLLVALVALSKDVYGFEFGSSRGSRDKDKPRPGGVKKEE